MADSNVKKILSVCATVGSKLPNLEIKNGQLIFVRDKHRLAFDYDDKRVFYNQIEELDTEADRISILAPVSGCYYFVIETAVLWIYKNDWIQITTPPEEVVCIGTKLPELGSIKTLYVNKQEKEISVWNQETSEYITVSNYSDSINDTEIDSLFK